MMLFRSRGVRATLSTADLDAPLSKATTTTTTLRSGKERARDDQPVEEALAAGVQLTSLPIDTDGSEKGVLQYIGDHEDMAFMMTEAREESSQFDSSTPREPQALRLSVSTNESTHDANKRVKIEVYLNGALCDVYLVKHREEGLAATYTTNGTRIHEQVDMPWIYQPSTTRPSSAQTAKTRWMGTSLALKEEVRGRGVDRWGHRPPGADFLAALADIPLPAGLVDHAHMAIVDIVVVSGTDVRDSGTGGSIAQSTRSRTKKHALLNALSSSDLRQSSPVRGTPSAGASERDGEWWLGQPPSPAASTSLRAEDNPFADGQGAEPAERLRSYAAPAPPSTSPASPLVGRQRPRKPNAKVNTPRTAGRRTVAETEQAAKEFAENHGIAWRKDAMIENFKDRRGAARGNRSLTHRILDLQKMTPKNRAAAVRRLQQDYPAERVTPPRTQRKSNVMPLKPGTPSSNLLAAVMQSPTTPKPAAVKVVREEGARGTRNQSRVDLAIAYGAAPNGRLVKLLAAYSPPKLGESWDTPMLLDSSSSVEQPPSRAAWVAPLLPQSSVRKTRRTLRRLDNPTPDEAIAGFLIPESCFGTAISYAENHAQQRQVAKTRPDKFKEQDVIVGMRFVVV